MTENKQNESSLFPAQEIEEDFKFFRIIENTILGILAFIGRFIATTFLVLFKPWRLRPILEDRKDRLARPFTFLTVASFAGGLTYRYFSPVGGRSVSEIPDELRQTSLVDLLQATFPILIIAVVIGLGVAHSLALPNSGRKRLVLEVACYGIGAQLLAFTVVGLVVYGYRVLPEPIGFALSFVTWPLTIYAVVLPSLLLSIAFWRELTARSVFHRAYLVPGLILLGPILLISNWKALDFVKADPYSNIYANPVVTCVYSEGKALEDGRISFLIVVTNESPTPLFLSSSIESYSIHATDYSDRITFNSVELVDWGATSKEVMHVLPKETAWLKLAVDPAGPVEGKIARPTSFWTWHSGIQLATHLYGSLPCAEPELFMRPMDMYRRGVSPFFFDFEPTEDAT